MQISWVTQRMRDVCLLGALLWGSGICLAQTSPAPKPPVPNLATALAEAVPPAQGLALSVDAEKILLPKDAVLPGTTPTVADTAGIYERTTQRFGLVTAIAPPTMTVLNTAPGEPNIYAGMPALDAFTLLCASFTDAQWTALTSEQGLSVGDLNTPAQQQLFGALLTRDGKLIVRPDYASDEKWSDADKRDLTNTLPQAHLRMGQTISFMLPVKDQPSSYFGASPLSPSPGSPRTYVMDDSQNYDGESDSIYGARVRAEVPNVPKPGQLDFSAPLLRTVVTVSSLKTVGDLVYRIGAATHTELYVDKRLEGLSLTVRGAPVAPAADLLRALAFCVTGTYRQVGPAYVLTDDLVGVGTRRQIWAEFEQEADDLRRAPVQQAANSIYARRSARALSWFGDPAAYSPDEAKAQDQPIVRNGDMLPEIDRPLAELTPAQQDIVQRSVEQFNRTYKMQQATSDGKIQIRPGLRVQLLVPGISAPIALNNINGGNVDQSFLWQPSQEASDADLAAYRAQHAKERPEGDAKMPPPVPASVVLTALRHVPRRAVMVHARTAKDVDSAVAAMKTLGLNELWLDVFSGGVAHVPGSALSSIPTGAGDILTEALLKTKGTGIRVFPTFSLLFWGQSPPAQDADHNILGETSAQAAARWQQRKESLPPGQEMQEVYTTGGIIPDWDGVAVSPASPEVRQTLTALVQKETSRPGVSGLVWRDTDTPGYDMLPSIQESSPLALGYQDTMRLAFLRRWHADPVDIIPPGAYCKANTNLPHFSMDYYFSANANQQLSSQWGQFRQGMSLSLLQTLYAAANPFPLRHTAIYIKQRRRGQGGNDGLGHHIYPPGWYGSWDNPRLPLPTLHQEGEDNAPGQPMLPVGDADTQAHAQSRAFLVPITGGEIEQMRQMFAVPQGHAYLISHLPPSFVLDLDDDNAAGESALVALAKTSLSAGPGPAPK